MNQSHLPGEDVEVFYFGSSEKLLFGIFHRPPPQTARRTGVVLCPPIEQEYIRCHRAYRQWAVRLARAGFPVLRFDYYGTGDSAGDDAVQGLSQWRDDISAAVEELKNRGRLSAVCLGGLRLGAALASQVAAERQDITGLALWEPVVSGQEYLQELLEWHQDKLWYFLSDVQNAPETNVRPSELLGLALTPTMLDDFNQLNLLSTTQPPADRILIIENNATEPAKELLAHFEKLESGVLYKVVAGPRVWSDDPDKALVPHEVLQAMVAWMSEVAE